jgi:predicted nucleic acid-binding protein
VTGLFYIDTSVLAHAVLGTDPAAANWFRAASVNADLMASSLLRLEITRLLRRESLDLSLAEPHLQRVALISISDQTLRLAGTFISHIKTLDSIHLATLLLADSNATLATHDMAVAQAARTLGIAVHDPLV